MAGSTNCSMAVPTSREYGLGLGRRASFAAHERVCNQRRSLHQEPEPGGHLARVAREVAARQGLVVAAIDADQSQQRMLCIGGQANPRERGLAVRVTVHDALPAGKAPRRRAEMYARRQLPPESHDGVVDLRCPNAGHSARRRRDLVVEQ
jgi:hypothetical protein